MIPNTDTIDASNAVIILPCEEGVVAHVVCYDDHWVGTVFTSSHLLQVFTIEAARKLVQCIREDDYRLMPSIPDFRFYHITLSINKGGQINKDWIPCNEEVPTIMHNPCELVTKWLSVQEVIKI
jgi:hypothetical protein